MTLRDSVGLLLLRFVDHGHANSPLNPFATSQYP